MSNTTPTFIYWRVASRAHLPMLLLAAGDVSYKLDAETANSWPSKKEEMPFGQLPVLQHNEMTLGQSGAIARYCAKLAGLMPKSDSEYAVVDSVMEQCVDVFNSMVKAKYCQGDKENAWKLFENELLQKMNWVNKMLEEKNTKYFGGDKVNAADVSVFAVLNLVEKAGITLPKWTHLASLYEDVGSMPSVLKYLAENYPPYFQKE